MEENKDKGENRGINRRKYLGSVGAVGTFVAASGLATASPDKEKFRPAAKEEMRKIHSSRRVGSITKEVDGLQIRQERTQYAELTISDREIK